MKKSSKIKKGSGGCRLLYMPLQIVKADVERGLAQHGPSGATGETGVSGPSGATGPTEPESPFRAIFTVTQTAPANTDIKVLYPFEEIDINIEYNPSASTFIPNQSSVYALWSIVFFTNSDFFDQSVILQIRVNGNVRIIGKEIVN